MQIAVFSRTLKEEDIPYIQSLFNILLSFESAIYVQEKYLNAIKAHIEPPAQIRTFKHYYDIKALRINFFITLGGDGTILEAITYIRELDIPIIGINLGRLGFLANIEKRTFVEALNEIKKGKYHVEERQLLQLVSSPPLFGDLPFALNDCTIHKRDTSSMITIHAFIDNQYLNSYWADGIIIATPTGSTGYSLSCGGPIVYPNSGNLVITPIAPHNLSVRPIVISDSSEITLKIEGRAENFLCTLDSRFETITAAHSLVVKKNTFAIKLVQLESKNFLDTMREKLTWGMDSRNH